jgi:hypothetical protein
MNNWGIPAWLEEKVKIRDKFCIYCGIEMKDYPHTKGTPRDKATWEHIDNDGPSDSELNVARCCAACNASKGTKKLADWLESPYCREKKVKEKAAGIVQNFVNSSDVSGAASPTREGQD